MAEAHNPNLPTSWIALATSLTIFELFLLYEAMLADSAGDEKIFGVFVGLAIVCFAAVLYAVSVVLYGWE